MKFTIVPNNSKNIEEYKKIGANAFIFPLKDYSCGYETYFELKDIENIKKKNNDIEIFISLNKNFFNEELDSLKEVLLAIDKLSIDGILFYDMAILRYKKELKLKTDLVWNQTFMVTNYNTCNYYLDKGVNYAVVSKEITIDEINEIANKSNIKLMANIFCYPIMSYTRRSLVTNYHKAHNIKSKNNRYVMKNNNEDYIINEEEDGSALYMGKLLNGSTIINEIKTNYVILNESFIDHELFIKIFEMFIKLHDTKDVNIQKEIDNLIGDYRAFFNTKTIYKVKKNG
jgi:putative protease